VVVDALLFAARSLFQTDREAFTTLLDELRSFDSRFWARLPAKIRIPSMVFGYPRAEEIASGARAVKKLIRG
jgi:hypothetical protein